MSLSRIDIVRTQEVSQLKHIENQRNQQAQDQIEKSFQTMIKHDMQKPTKATNSENKQFRYDSKEKGNNQYKGEPKTKKNKKEEKEKSKGVNPSGGGFDILI